MPRKTAYSSTLRTGCPGFNEAAARCHGKLGLLSYTAGSARHASMRPRPDATENGRSYVRGLPARLGFNEAAARCHGKLALPRVSS